MIHEDNKRLTLFIAIGIGFFVLVLIIIGFYIKSLQNPNGDSIRINNFDTYVKNIPRSERDIIESTLYSTVLLNTPDEDKVKSIKDAIIRDGSYNQTFSEDIYTTTFIIDIESIKQSYEIRDLYSRLDREESGLHDYTTVALCLPSTKLKYGEFTCQDRSSQENGINESDPILQYLPHSTLDYTLRLDTKSKDLKLIAEISLSEIDYKLGVDSAVNKYKNRLQQWFNSKELNINNYSITYVY